MGNHSSLANEQEHIMLLITNNNVSDQQISPQTALVRLQYIVNIALYSDYTRDYSL